MEFNQLQYNSLVDEALLYARHYYLLKESLVSDELYDALFSRIKEYEESYDIVIRKDSPTQSVGSSQFLENSSIKATHKYSKLLSLANVFNEEELRAWFNKYNYDDLVITPKLDGINLSCYYDLGNLVKVLTRGDGEIGQDVTNLAYFISGIPTQIEDRVPLRVEGEAYCYNFETVGKDYKNHRNYVAGSLNLKDVNKFSTREINFITHSLTVPKGHSFTKYTEQLNYLNDLGFDIPSYTCKSLGNSFDPFDVPKEITNYKYIDGLVYRINKLDLLTEKTAHHPKYAVAYKFPQEKVKTKLLGVNFSIGGFKQVTPVAILEPVEINGATVQKASLANMLNVRNLGICINDYVYVIRAGEVIPQIVGLAEKGENRIPIECINCPSCMEPLKELNGQLFCKNTLCDAGDLKQYIKFTKTIDIKGLGEKTLENLYKAKQIKSFVDIINLDGDIINKYASSGLKNAGKIEEELERVQKEVSRQKMWGAISIPGLGVSMAEAIGEYHNSLVNLKLADLLYVPKLGVITANKILKWINDNVEQLKELEAMFSYKKTEQVSSKGTVVISGTMKISRKAIKQQLEKLGWTVNNAVTKNTSYLLVGKNPGKKHDQARIKGISIVDYDTERHLLNLA